MHAKLWIISATALLLAVSVGAQSPEPTPWNAETDCETKQIDSLKQATQATLKDQAELALLKADAYGQLKTMVRTC